MPISIPGATVIEPFEDQVFCRMYAQSDRMTAKSRIIIPGTAREEIFLANVVKVGPGKTFDYTEDMEPMHEPMRIAPGMDIVFLRFHGERIQIEESLYVILKQGDILARLTIPEEEKGKLFRWAKIGEDGE